MFVVHLGPALPTWMLLGKKGNTQTKSLTPSLMTKFHINNADVVDEDKSNLLTEKNKMVEQQSFVSIFVAPSNFIVHSMRYPLRIL